MGKYVGRDIIMEYAIGNPDADPNTLTFSVLGMMRDKGMSVSWDTADATADKSPNFTKENLVTFKSVEFKGSGVSRNEAVHNQIALKQLVYSPGAGTSNQPFVWLRQTAPDGVIQGPFIVNSWEDAAPYSDTATWSLGAMSNGDVTFIPS